MRIDAFREHSYLFSGDIWSFVTTTDPSGGPIRHYSLKHRTYFELVTTGGAYGKMTVYFGPGADDYAVGYQIHVLTTPDGTLLSKGGYWQIDGIAPALNIWGGLEGYKAKISLVALDGTSGGVVTG